MHGRHENPFINIALILLKSRHNLIVSVVPNGGGVCFRLVLGLFVLTLSSNPGIPLMTRRPGG
jgi:hypothetical protein